MENDSKRRYFSFFSSRAKKTKKKKERMELFISWLVAAFISNDYTFQRARREIKEKKGKKKNWNEASLLIITWLAARNTVALISILKKILGRVVILRFDL